MKGKYGLSAEGTAAGGKTAAALFCFALRGALARLDSAAERSTDHFDLGHRSVLAGVVKRLSASFGLSCAEMVWGSAAEKTHILSAWAVRGR